MRNGRNRSGVFSTILYGVPAVIRSGAGVEAWVFEFGAILMIVYNSNGGVCFEL
jgi:hypothetical protein